MCGRCHGEKSATYLDTYHGKSCRWATTPAPSAPTATGYHKILPKSDPDSTVS